MREHIDRIKNRNNALLETETPRIVEELIRMGAVRITLFGSCARGDTGITSDLDLLVVIEDNRDYLSRIKNIYRQVKPRVALDILVYTTQEFAEQKQKNFFLRNILMEGVTLYEKATEGRGT